VAAGSWSLATVPDVPVHPPRRLAVVRGRSSARALIVLVAGSLALGGCGDVLTLSTGDALDVAVQPQTSLVLGSDGSVVAELHGLEDRTAVPLDEVADVLVQAVVAVEDRRFFTHGGVDLPGIVRALRENVAAGEIEQGGSTITQQYVKSTITGDAVTVERKVEEAVLAWQLEQEHGKDWILEQYLNTVYFGAGAYGVAAAARTYFDIAPGELNLAQAALLAGLIRSPSSLDPRRNPEAAGARRSVVLDAMVDLGVVTSTAADAVRATPVALAPPPPADPDAGGWFVDEVRRVLAADDAFAVLGGTPDERENALLTGGLTVTTTLDPTIQAVAEQSVLDVLSDPDDPTAAVVVLEPGTGAVRALVGGRTDDGIVGGFSTATMARRQPGSAFKPIVLATALERGTPLDRVFAGGACRSFPDVPGWEQGVCNYGGTEYGPLTLREATVRSVNTVYAELGVELGPTAMLQEARNLGIGGELPAVHALALGAGEVTPLDLATAYAPFATLGQRNDVHLVERIEGPDGTLLYEHVVPAYDVLDEGVAHFVTTTLAEVVDRGTGVLADIGRPQAGKTGTSQDSADAWFVGYTPDLLAAVWVGFEEGRVPMVPPRTRELVEGGRWPAEIWADLMGEVLADRAPTPFAVPSTGVSYVEVDVTRNCLPNPYTPPELVEVREYPPGAAPTQTCTEPTGPPVDDVPALVGLPVTTALSLLSEEGFAVEVRPVAPTLYPTGVVELQRPAPGGATDPTDGNAVVLWVSTVSRSRVAVPDVRSQEADTARRVLESAGFVVALVDTVCPAPAAPDQQPSGPSDPDTAPAADATAAVSCERPGTIVVQEPAAGTRAPEHAVVLLGVLSGVPDAPGR
jgi:penicillin-binding protein 1A